MCRLHTRKALEERSIVARGADRMPAPCSLSDLEAAKLVVALKETEHRPLLTERFRGWEDRVTYWHVDGVDIASPVAALSEIDVQVEILIRRLRQL